MWVFLVIGFALGEWTGELHLTGVSSVYSNLTSLGINVSSKQKRFNSSGLVCLEGLCSKEDSSAIVIAYLGKNLNETISYSESLNASAVILITDETEIEWPLNYTGFRMNQTEGQKLTEEVNSVEYAWGNLVYYFKCKDYLDHCERLQYLEVLFEILLYLWLGFLGWWFYNNHYKNAEHAEHFHKLSTLVLVFKFLNILASLSEVKNCPPTTVSSELLGLMRKQCRTLYETSFFSLILLLSKGWLVSRNNMSRNEFNYIVLVLIGVYIMDSATNIIGSPVAFMTFFMYAGLMFHGATYCYSTWKGIQAHIDLVQQTGINHLSAVCEYKKVMFSRFMLLFFGYFLAEALIHFVVENLFVDLDAYMQTKIAIWYSFHEAMELAILMSIFFLYRARYLGRYFSLLVFEMEQPVSRSIIPFYQTAKKSVSSECIIATALPDNSIKLAKLLNN